MNAVAPQVPGHVRRQRRVLLTIIVTALVLSVALWASAILLLLGAV